MRREEIDATVREVWSKVLEVEVAGDTDFFDAGGHSFLAIQIIARLDQALPTRTPVTTLFDHPVLGDFVSAVAERLESEPVAR